MAAHQCPRCELRFSYRTEVEYHLATDHRPHSEQRVAAERPTPVDLKIVGSEVVRARAPKRS